MWLGPWVNVVPVTSDPVRRPSLDPAPLAALAPDLAVELLETATSTNAVAADRARDGAEEGLVVVAEHQTAGRGRLDRAWETPARSSLTFSLLVRPTVPPGDWPWLPLLTGHTVAKTLRAEGYAVGVKWPNDVLAGDRKLVGILVERVETPTGPAAVLGVGLNVSLTADELPVPTATSLALEPGATPDRTHLLVELLRSLREAYDAWQAGGADGTTRLRSSYAAACVTIGRDVRVDLPGGRVLTGRATGIDQAGRLVVLTGDGETVVGAGDVVHVRPVTSEPDQ
jgi:BirA family biotin operon repressor/biotin-[acetyl-CoA-carboxylase] ligase